MGIDCEENINISKRKYDELKEKADLLECLLACGVDNWEGYEDAWERMGFEE